MALDRRRMAVIAVAVAVLAVSLGPEAALSRMLSDKKPHKGVAAAHTMPVQRIDVSYWQDEIDWQRVSDAADPRHRPSAIAQSGCNRWCAVHSVLAGRAMVLPIEAPKICRLA